jgi:hypothetical protein
MRWPSASGVNLRSPQAAVNLPLSSAAATLAGSVEPAALIACSVTCFLLVGLDHRLADIGVLPRDPAHVDQRALHLRAMLGNEAVGRGAGAHVGDQRRHA